MLEASPGEWSGSPTSYSYQWLACEAGGQCIELPEASGPTYTAIGPEVGYTLRVLVTATGAGGSQTAVSEETDEVKEAPPANLSPPQVTGSTLIGQKLTASPGEWSGSPTAYAYQWQSCSGIGVCAAISGATSPTHTLTVSDVGHTIRVLVTATGVGGSQTATSEQTATITEPPPPATLNTSMPKIAGTTVEGQKLTASPGEWSGSPTAYAYQWQSCSGIGVCAAIERRDQPNAHADRLRCRSHDPRSRHRDRSGRLSDGDLRTDGDDHRTGILIGADQLHQQPGGLWLPGLQFGERRTGRGLLVAHAIGRNDDQQIWHDG